ncbi:hypothetical protein XENORESO_008062 [Xenotaenia resolanae]|uniref:Uncharacterized protein n=1 Tax=Xenotaenia resolanae TaxID=208358 RepID=A0ABV0VWG6_9TELE
MDIVPSLTLPIHTLYSQVQVPIPQTKEGGKKRGLPGPNKPANSLHHTPTTTHHHHCNDSLGRNNNQLSSTVTAQPIQMPVTTHPKRGHNPHPPHMLQPFHTSTAEVPQHAGSTHFRKAHPAAPTRPASPFTKASHNQKARSFSRPPTSEGKQ